MVNPKHRIPLLASIAAIVGKDYLEYDAAEQRKDYSKDTNSSESMNRRQAAEEKRAKKNAKRAAQLLKNKEANQ